MKQQAYDWVQELKQQQEEIRQIRQQRILVSSLNQQLQKKQKQIEQLKDKLQKQNTYKQKNLVLKSRLNTMEHHVDNLELEKKLLKQSLDQSRLEFENLKNQLAIAQKECISLTLERQQIEVQHSYSAIQQTNLNNFYRISTDLKTKGKCTSLKIKNIQIINLRFGVDYAELTSKLTQLENGKQEKKHQQSGKKVFKIKEGELTKDLQQLRVNLRAKDEDLQKARTLNNRLSIEFDKSVRKVAELEKELSGYRKENHQLKKTLAMMVEGERVQKHCQLNLSEQGSEEGSSDPSDIECV